jgi:hypothetical protein
MRRLLSVAPITILAVACASSPVFAQRGGGHGGPSGHSAPSFHGGFSGSGPAFHGPTSSGFASSPRFGFTAPQRYGCSTAPRYCFGAPASNRFNPSQRYPASRFGIVAPRFGAPGYRAAGIATSAAIASYARSGFAGDSGHRIPYRPLYRRDHGVGVWPVWPINYGYPAYPGFYGDPSWWDYDDSLNDQGYGSQTPAPQDYGLQPEDQQRAAYPESPAWPYSNAPQNSSQPSAPAQSAEPVTLVFNDGRPPVTIHDYLLTRGTLYVMDRHRSEIPVAELDLPATAKVNREAGIDFKLPGTSR